VSEGRSLSSGFPAEMLFTALSTTKEKLECQLTENLISVLNINKRKTGRHWTSASTISSISLRHLEQDTEM
jgi:hypothetical protein